jgi:hypothetical protein
MAENIEIVKNEFKPYHMAFGKYKGIAFVEMLKHKNYIMYLNKLEEKSNAVKFFLNWIDLNEQKNN